MQEKEADLKGVVQQLKARFASLKYVYAWHALHGYWAGEFLSLEHIFRDRVGGVTCSMQKLRIVGAQTKNTLNVETVVA